MCGLCEQPELAQGKPVDADDIKEYLLPVQVLSYPLTREAIVQGQCAVQSVQGNAELPVTKNTGQRTR